MSGHRWARVTERGALTGAPITAIISTLSILGAVLLAVIASTGVVALARAETRHSITIPADRWSAVAVPRGGSPGSGPLTMSFHVNRGVPRQYIDVVNTGTLALTGQSYVIRAANGASTPQLTLEACSNGSWSPTDHSCSGTVVTMGTTSSGPTIAFASPLAPGGRLAVRATTSPSTASKTTIILDVKIARSQIRAGATTTS